MVQCCVKTCSNNSSSSGIKTFTFPRDPELKKKWIESVGLDDQKGANPNTRICGAHFDVGSWSHNLLKSGSVPSLFCRCPPNRQPLGDHSNSPNGQILGDHSNYVKPKHTPHIIQRGKAASQSRNKENPEMTCKSRGRPRRDTRLHSQTCPFHPSNIAIRDSAFLKAQQAEKIADILEPAKRAIYQEAVSMSPDLIGNSSNLPVPEILAETVASPNSPASLSAFSDADSSSCAVSVSTADVSDHATSSPAPEILAETVAPPNSPASLSALPDADSSSAVSVSTAGVGIDSTSSPVSDNLAATVMSPNSSASLPDFSDADSSSSAVFGSPQRAAFTRPSSNTSDVASVENQIAELERVAATLMTSNIELLARIPSVSPSTNTGALKLTEKLAELERTIASFASSNRQLRAENDRLQRELERQAATSLKMRRQREELRVPTYKLQQKLRKIEEMLGERVQPDQIRALALKTTNGMKWSNKTLLLGYKLHFSCGTTGYETVCKYQLPLPATRTLQRHIQSLKIEPGPFHQVFGLLKAKVPFLPFNEFVLGLDEMSLMPKVEFDPNLGRMIGRCTLPAQAPVTSEMRRKYGGDMTKIAEARRMIQDQSLQQKADKGMILALASLLGPRCKQIVGCHLTGKSISGSHLKEEVLKIIALSHDSGMFVRVIVCDMGNGTLLRELGIDGGRGRLVNSIQHPVVPTEKLFVTPDSVHVFKNIVVMFAQHKKVYLPADIVEAFRLPTSVADYADIEFLQKYQQDMAWRLAPNLRASDLVGGHFRKMKVNNAVNIVNHRTAAALKFLSNLLSRPAMLTTAFFVELLYAWFKFMTARNPSMAMGKKNAEAYEGAIETLNTTLHLFENLRFGSEAGDWKPCQTGVKLSTRTVLDLAEFYLDVKGAKMFFPGGLTQDFIENINSLVRIARPLPTPRQWKDRLRRLLVAQFMKKIVGSSYDFDGAEDLLSPLNDADPDKAASVESDFTDEGASPQEEENRRCVQSLTQKELPVFYRVCGYVVFQVLRQHAEIRGCAACVASLKSDSPHVYSLFTRLTNYTADNLVEVSDNAFRLLVEAENFILQKKNQFNLENANELSRFVQTIVMSANVPNFPDCHAVQSTLLKRFMQMRVRLGFDGFFQSEEQHVGSQFSSKTTGAKFLADRMK